MLTAEAAVEPVIGDEQVEHGRDKRLAVLQSDALGRHLPDQYAWMISALEGVMLAVAEIRKRDIGEFIHIGCKCEPEIGVPALRGLLFKVPLSLLTPSESD